MRVRYSRLVSAVDRDAQRWAHVPGMNFQIRKWIERSLTSQMEWTRLANWTFPPRCPCLHVVQIGYDDAIWIPYIQVLKIFSGGRHWKTVILQCFQQGLTYKQAQEANHSDKDGSGVVVHYLQMSRRCQRVVSAHTSCFSDPSNSEMALVYVLTKLNKNRKNLNISYPSFHNMLACPTKMEEMLSTKYRTLQSQFH